MRVTIIGRDFPPAIGGIGDHTDLLATELARRGNAVTVVCSPPAEQRAAFTVTPAAERWDAAGHDTIVSAVRASQPHAIVWQYNPFSVGRKGLAPRVGSLARRLAALAPVVLLAHELWYPWGRGGLKGALWAAVHRIQMRALVRAAGRIVVTTPQRLEQLPRAARAKASVVPIGANIEPKQGSRDGRAEMGIPTGAFVVAHLGSAGPGREMGALYEAVASLRDGGVDARLLLAGDTGPLTVPADLNGVVIAPGVGSRDEVSAALASADAYVHPDLVGPAAGRRGSLVAALAHGLPIVAFRGPDQAPELHDGTNVVLCDATGASLARALGALASNQEAARAIGAAAKETYEKSFAWMHAGDGVLHAIEEAIR